MSFGLILIRQLADCLLWNNGLREAVVTDTFLFLSTFFVQVLNLSYKQDILLSTRISLFFTKPVYNYLMIIL